VVGSPAGLATVTMQDPSRPAAAGGMGNLARHSAVSVGGAVSAGLLNAVLAIVVTRGFSKPEAGTFFATTSIFVMLYTVTRLGAGTGTVYYISRHRALGRHDRIRPTLRAAIGPVLLASVLACGAVLVWAPKLAESWGHGADAGVGGPLRVLSVFLPLAALSDLCVASARGFARLGPLVLVEKVARPSLQVLGVLTVAFTGASAAVWLPLAWAAPYGISFALGAVWLRRLVQNASPLDQTRGRRVSGEGRTFWRFTAPRSITSIVQVALQRLDVVLVFGLLGPSQAAIYAAATRFLVFGQLVTQALSTATQHRFAHLLALEEHAAAKSLYGLVTGWLVLIAWPIYLVLVVFGDYALAVFGEGYGAGWPVIAVLCGAMLMSTGCGMVDNVLNMAGKTAWTLANSVAALVANVVLNLVLIPRWGLLGAATAWAAAIAINNLLPLGQLATSLRLHPFGRGLWAAAGLSIVAFAAVAGAARSTLGAPAALALAVMTYAAGIILWRRTLAVDALLRQLRSGHGRGTRSEGVQAATTR